MRYLRKSFFVLQLFFLPVIAGINSLKAQVFKVDTIIYNGDPAKFINIVFMGDGFQAGEITDYILNVRSLTDYFFKTSPFTEYKTYFNVFAISVPSPQSGANHPGNATDESSSGGQPTLTVNNYFNSTFDYFSIHRLLVPQNSPAINNVLFTNFPLFDQTFMLVNSTYYGGSGGANIAASSLNNNSYEVLVHEVGHSFAGLSDEYYAGDFYAGENTNMTKETSPSLVRWKDWLGYNGVGIYQHCCGGNSGLWYKPHQSCKMQFLGQPFCPVCTEKIIETIHSKLPALRSFEPAAQSTISYCSNPVKFRLSLNKPSPNTVKVKWVLNGSVIDYNVDSIVIDGSRLIVGDNNLSAIVIDSTMLVRAASHFINHADTVRWTISSTIIAPVVTAGGPLTFCQGGSVTLTSVAGSSYLWSNGLTTQSISVTSSGIYSVTRKDAGGCSAASLPVTITVNTAPPQPVTINGANNVCSGSNQNYSVDAVVGATTYSWALPAGWTGSSTGSTISATTGTTGGLVSVKANNTCGNSVAKTLDVSIKPVPPIPGDITGILSANVGQSIDYSINPVNGATGYNWSVNGGGTISSGQNTSAVVVNWTTAGSHTLTVTAANSCGNSAGKSINVNVSVATGIFDPDDEFLIRVLPNPTTGEFYLQAKHTINKEMRIQIVNMTGQTVYKNKLTIRTDDFSQRIDISNMADGIYNVLIDIKKKRYLRKMVKGQ